MIAPLLFTSYFEWDAALFHRLPGLTRDRLLGLHQSRVCNRVSRETHQVRPGAPALRSSRHYGARATVRSLWSSLIDLSELLGSTAMTNVRWSCPKFLRHAHDSRTQSRRRTLEAIRSIPRHNYARLAIHQRIAPSRADHLLTDIEAGVGHAIDYFHKHLPPGQLRLGVVGLGAGTLAAYPDAGDSITFYEINPTVIQLAESGDWFTYVRDCRARGAHCDIRLGDARLTLQRELAVSFPSPLRGGARGGEALQVDELPPIMSSVLDAFSGDSVPVHLLTIEAFELYLARLATATNSRRQTNRERRASPFTSPTVISISNR